MVHLDPGYLRRLRGMAVSGPLLVHLWVRGVQYLLAADPTAGGADPAELAPGLGDLAARAAAGPGAVAALGAAVPEARLPPDPGGLQRAGARLPRRLAGRSRRRPLTLPKDRLIPRTA